MENFVAMDIQRTAVQILETVNIIGSSKKIETIISRYQFLLETLETLRRYNSSLQFSKSIQSAVEQYKNMYPNRPLNNDQVSVLSSPGTFPLDRFYCGSLVNAMQRFVDEQKLEIRSLKTENARQKRRIKVNESIQKAISELQEQLDGTACFETSLQQLKHLTLINEL
jgi:hypothetical protein